MKLIKPPIFNHKKFQAASFAFLAALFGILGPAMAESTTFWLALGSITPAEWTLILGPILVAIGAQGWADSGKEAAKINTNQTDSIKKLAGSKEEPVDQTQ